MKVMYWEVFLENPCGRGVGRCVVTSSLSVPVTKKIPNVELPVLKLEQSQADPGSWPPLLRKGRRPIRMCHQQGSAGGNFGSSPGDDLDNCTTPLLMKR